MRGNFSLAKSMRAHPKAMIFEISFFLCRPAQDPSQKKAKNVSALKFFNFRITVFCHSSMKTASFVRESPSPKAKIFGNSKKKEKIFFYGIAIFPRIIAFGEGDSAAKQP